MDKRVFILFVSTGLPSDVANLCSKSIDKFRNHAKVINATEVDGLARVELLNYCCSKFNQLQTKLSNTEKELDANDIEMCDL